MEKSWGVLVNKLVMAQSDGKFPFLFYFFVDSIAVSLYMDDLVEFYKFVAGNKIQISILILRRGALSKKTPPDRPQLSCTGAEEGDAKE